MSAGYGRGYYGDGQLAKTPPRRRSWFTWVAVLGAGAAVTWFLWPRKTAYDPLPDFREAERQPPVASGSPLVVINTSSAQLGSSMPVGAFMKQVEDDARARGFAMVKDYEDSVVATAKELQATGAKVVLAPHLQHLTPQLGS